MELKVIENELVPVYETSTGEKVVYGTELHRVLDVKSPYREWSTRRLKDCDSTENEDFEAVEISTPSGQTMKQHIIKLDTAKEMAMLERNDKGKQVRRYFIQVEKKYKDRLNEPKSPLQLLELEFAAIKEVDTKVDAVNKDLQDFKQDMPLLGIEESRITAAVKKRGVECLGGKSAEAYQDKSLRGRVYSDIYGQLKREFGVCTYKAIKRSQCDRAVSEIVSYRLPLILEEAVADRNAQMHLC